VPEPQSALDESSGDLCLRYSRYLRVILPVFLFSALGFLVMGYHPGAEDDGVYLTAVKADLNPALFPHDADFFRLQMRTSMFDGWMAGFVRFSHIPVAYAELLWQLISIAMILWACWTIVSQLFEEAAARWAGIALVSAMFTLPVAGTALYLVDQHLHPRAPASALILFAVSRILARRSWQAAPLMVLAFVIHPLMGALGISFCCVLTMTHSEPLKDRWRGLLRFWKERMSAPEPEAVEVTPMAALIPFGWMLAAPSPIWLEAIRSRHWFRLYEWAWYEWLGAIGPIVIFGVISRIARKRGEITLSRFAAAIFFYGIFQQAFAMIVLGPTSLIGLSALEPMRYLHLVYVFLALVMGAYMGRYLLKTHVWRWAIFLALANGGMFLAQRELFAASPHLEMPGAVSGNAWLQAFDWIKHNTPEDAYFAVDPNYMAVEGEDYHSFRALAERSMLSDNIKDTSVITKVPELGPVWKEQQLAMAGWPQFQAEDFERLKAKFGVDWVLVAYPQQAGLDCRWHNAVVAVCRIP
jgi:hypothetical protein